LTDGKIIQNPARGIGEDVRGVDAQAGPDDEQFVAVVAQGRSRSRTGD